MTRALVTAFEPFGGESVNASLAAVQRLPARIGAIHVIDVTTAQLPTSYARSLATLKNAIAGAQPDIVLCVGQAADRDALCLERVAINVQDACIADNDGAMPQDRPIIADGPAAYFATLPVQAATAALRAAGLAAEVSNSAGTFVCNHVFYGLMHYAALHRRHMRAGMLHVPRVRARDGKHGAAESGVQGMLLDDIVRGIVIALQAMDAK